MIRRLPPFGGGEKEADVVIIMQRSPIDTVQFRKLGGGHFYSVLPHHKIAPFPVLTLQLL